MTSAPTWQNLSQMPGGMSMENHVGSQRRAPLLGDWWNFQRDRLGFLTACHRRFGQTVRLRIVRSTFFINEPDDIHHVLVDRAANYAKSWQTSGRAGRRHGRDTQCPYTIRLHIRCGRQPYV